VNAVMVIHGLPVRTFEGKTIGRVVGETESAYIVERRRLFRRRTLRALPKRYASVNTSEQRVQMGCSKELLLGSPKVSEDRMVDEQVFNDYWGLD
jgi:hypothetical protein